jgi:hypothetical protein
MRNLLPHFSGKLYLDEDCENWARRILRNQSINFFIDNIMVSHQLTHSNSLFPHNLRTGPIWPEGLQKLKNERLALIRGHYSIWPGWKLRTTSPNTRMASSYYGTDYWHHGNQEVGVVNRSTMLKIWVHYEHIMKRVPFEHHVQQINSVRTIAYKVVDVLQEVNWKNGLNFQLLCTAQSLGSRWTKPLPLSFNILL